MRRTAGPKHIAQIPEMQTKPELSLSHETHCRGPGPRVSRLRNSRTCRPTSLSQAEVLPTAAGGLQLRFALPTMPRHGRAFLERISYRQIQAVTSYSPLREIVRSTKGRYTDRPCARANVRTVLQKRRLLHGGDALELSRAIALVALHRTFADRSRISMVVGRGDRVETRRGEARWTARESTRPRVK